MNAVERVKALCKERHISISKLEKACGFGNAYIANLRNGRLPYDRLVTIANYLDVSPEYIASGDEKPAAETGDGKAFNPRYADLSPDDRATVDALIDRLLQGGQSDH